MKIGDRIFVRGYIDEIRKDTVIVRNDGGYFGTIPSEVITGELPSVQAEIIRCKDCKHWREGTSFSYCDKLHGMGVLDALDYMTAEDDYCSMAERREK